MKQSIQLREESAVANLTVFVDDGVLSKLPDVCVIDGLRTEAWYPLGFTVAAGIAASDGRRLLVKSSSQAGLSVNPANSESPRVPPLVSDFRRLLFSASIGAVSIIAAEGRYIGAMGGSLTANAVIVGIYGYYPPSSLSYLILTLAVFQGAGPDTLALWLTGTEPTGRLSKAHATATNIPAQWSIVAIGSVVVLVFSASLLGQPWVVVLSAAVVTTSWLVTLVSYAVHYARVATTVGGLKFPGDGDVVFWDCLYLATQVHTTFSSSDVTVETTSIRRKITGHTLLAFAFNTVIIALL